MKLEAVIVCKDYSDFLLHTLPENSQHFDRVVVVTHPEDGQTKALCNKYSIDFVETTAFHIDGDKFNKGRAINIGLGHLRGEDWLLHIDADILLPHRFRDLLKRANLDKKNIYGADRVNVYGLDHWQEHKDKITPHYSQRYFVQPPKEFPLGARIIHAEHGYTPIGYFQLWNVAAHRRYPINQGNAEHTDVLFSALWPRENRILLPEVIVYHLESQCGPTEMGKNWNGRKSPRFEKCHDPKHNHGHHGHHHPHCHHHYPHPCPPPYTPIIEAKEK